MKNSTKLLFIILSSLAFILTSCVERSQNEEAMINLDKNLIDSTITIKSEDVVSIEISNVNDTHWKQLRVNGSREVSIGVFDDRMLIFTRNSSLLNYKAETYRLEAGEVVYVSFSGKNNEVLQISRL